MVLARDRGEHELADVFEGATWDEIEQRVSIATGPAENALRELRARRNDPLVGTEYLKVLRAIERAVALIVEHDPADNSGVLRVLKTYQDLKREIKGIEDEKKKP
jgi:hypothetical protein